MAEKNATVITLTLTSGGNVLMDACLDAYIATGDHKWFNESQNCHVAYVIRNL